MSTEPSQSDVSTPVLEIHKHTSHASALRLLSVYSFAGAFVLAISLRNEAFGTAALLLMLISAIQETYVKTGWLRWLAKKSRSHSQIWWSAERYPQQTQVVAHPRQIIAVPLENTNNALGFFTRWWLGLLWFSVALSTLGILSHSLDTTALPISMMMVLTALGLLSRFAQEPSDSTIRENHSAEVLGKALITELEKGNEAHNVVVLCFDKSTNYDGLKQFLHSYAALINHPQATVTVLVENEAEMLQGHKISTATEPVTETPICLLSPRLGKRPKEPASDELSDFEVKHCISPVHLIALRAGLSSSLVQVKKSASLPGLCTALVSLHNRPQYRGSKEFPPHPAALSGVTNVSEHNTSDELDSRLGAPEEGLGESEEPSKLIEHELNADDPQ